MDSSDFYYRRLPHWQPAGAEYFVTFRLKGSLPISVVKEFKREQYLIEESKSTDKSLTVLEKKRRETFKKYEETLDSGNFGPTWLVNFNIAKIIREALHYRDQEMYDLYAFCIMSNHVHVIFKLLDNGDFEFPVTEIFKKLKSYTVLKANRKLGRTGAFWQSESYDHVIQNQKELEHTIKYVLNNPVKAGLVNSWRDWEFNYCKPLFLDDLRLG
jgi:REP element-mobilizing transposase RayT